LLDELHVVTLLVMAQLNEKVPAQAAAEEKIDQLGFGTEFEAEAGAVQLNRKEVEVGAAAPAGSAYAIRTLSLENFKGFTKFEISFGRFNVVVGGNNSGKSTLLRAVRLAYELTRLHYARQKGINAEFYQGRSVPKSLLPVAQLRDLWPAGRMREGNRWIPCKVSMEFTSGHSLSFSIIGPWNAATSKIETADLKAMNAIPADIVNGFLSHPPEFVPASIGIVAEEEYRTPARRSALVASGRHNEIVRNYLSELTPEQSKELRDLLTKYFHASVFLPQFDEQKDQFISAIYRGDEGEHDLYSAGGGFLQIVEVLAFIFRGTPGVVLLDEPDSHLNSNLQHAFVDILEGLASTRNFQVIMATHSKEIINYVDPSRLIPVDRKETKAEALKKEASTVTILKELGAIDNVDAYQIVSKRSLLVVEGPNDRELLPRLAAKAGVVIFGGASRVSILPAHGVDKLSDGVGLQFLENVVGQKVKSLLLRDRDGLTEDWMKIVAGNSKRPMFIWPKDCLESYLVVPAAIHRILVEELGAVNAPPVGEIEKLVTKVLGSLYNPSQDRVATRLEDVEWRFRHKRITAGEANPVARQEMDRTWNTANNPLALASGKELLSRIREEIQNAWKVSFGNARIVEAMRPDDIHQDIKDLLQQAVKLLV
jgi:predicted ATPase